ncbi:PREDICTED: vitamin K-dependent gamma-carboxylase [Rhagoletis zephyria]|uniref:vitamin K-dependent gamma-carboxylase n=1 Tax=Rhagoletis zephyria TaxID=28612 RepID=UPI000811709D|nr:PREDICTED: vitamin K-dependent gamma-carboxylase [Rhagoletis zephyria]
MAAKNGLLAETSSNSTAVQKNKATDDGNANLNKKTAATCKGKCKFHEAFTFFTGYEIDNFTSYASFTNWLHRPVDASAIGVFRMLYGLAMCIDIAEERGGGQMDLRFGEPQHCHFPLFNDMRAVSFPLMGCIYLVMWLGALGIMLGYRFRLSCLVYIMPYWYIFLLDKPAWNNHSYLFGLVGTILLFTDANRYCSLDKYLQPNMPETVPYWNYFLVKFQFFVLYVYAGLKKFTAEWLSGYAMSSLSQHWVFRPFRSLLSAELTDLLIVHWFTAIFDFSIAFFMTWEATRLLATPFMISFHLMNSRLFVIGMFPWVCLAEVPLFFGFSWPRKLTFKRFVLHILTASKSKAQAQQLPAEKMSATTEATTKESAAPACDQNQISSAQSNDCQTVHIKSRGYAAKSRTALILAYCALQLFLPYSHFITKGYNNWTEGLYGYSWNMMVHTYDTVLTSVKLVDNNNGNVHYLDPYAFTEYDRWTKHADMAYQYAKCIAANIREDYAIDPQASPLSSTNISIYFDVWCSMNGRFQQRVFDPRVDLLKAEWSPFRHTPWTLPLLNELNYMRPKLKTMTNEVLGWSNYSDVIFVADFPGLTLDNYISPELTNVTLTILAGNVRYKSDDEDEFYFLTAGKSFVLKSGETHHITTIGQKPSSYLYTFMNKTMIDNELLIDDYSSKEPKPLLPLWDEFKSRVKNYKQFLKHMANCVLYLFYDVPIPMEVRERN